MTGYIAFLDTFPNKVLTIRGDINTQIGKDEITKFCLHNLPNRNSKYLTDFSQENSLIYMNTKFEKEGKLTPSQITLKDS